MSLIETKSEPDVSTTRTTPVLPISVIIPVRNEARNLPRCIESLANFAEVYVIDSQSTDDTIAIAESHGAKVIQFHYAGGWPKKRQWAMDTLSLTGDWILLLDADEVLTPELVEEIRRALQDPKMCGYSIRLQMYFLGRVLRHCDASFWKLSLFRKGRGRFECRLKDQDTSMADIEIHEHVVVDGPRSSCATHWSTTTSIPCPDTFSSTTNTRTGKRASCLAGGDAEELSADLFGTQAQRRRWLKRKLFRLPGSPVLFFCTAMFSASDFSTAHPA